MTSKVSESIYLDTSLPFEIRVADLVSRMTLEEKISQMVHESAAIPRLSIPAYNWWNECLHGVARAGIATVFPQAIGLAATWNPDLIGRIAEAISDEARAKHHESARHGDRGIYKGLTFWSPNINIVRDPRWGRTQETYGEDPYLTGRMAVAFVKGLQGNDPKYLKTVATPKHFAVHSGPESDRHHFDARVGWKDLRESYLPAFKASIQEGGAASIMGAYSRMNGEPCCASKTLLGDILREEWAFEGFVVSDCGAICDLHTHHKVTNSPAESAALAVNKGCDLNCGKAYAHLLAAVEKGLITEETIDRSVTRLFLARFRLGMFDPPEQVPYARIPYEVVDCPEHRQLALEAARQSVVLLKNEDNVLPFRDDLKCIAVIGPNADDLSVLLGNYFGMPSKHVTPLEGIQNRFSTGTRVWYAKGCETDYPCTEGFAEALAAAERAEVVVMVLGFSPELEGEEGDVAYSDGGGDRSNLHLPAVQQELLRAVHAIGKPLVLVLTGGSPIAVNWAQENVPAILMSWYLGEEGGTAIAETLFGDYCPGGRLPMTFPRSFEQMPPFMEYSMQGRTYKYFKGEALYPFGFGLSYTVFQYDRLALSAERIKAGETLEVAVEVQNTGKRDGDEVVQLYLRDDEASVPGPRYQLEGFQRIHLAQGDKQRVTFCLTPRQMGMIANDGRLVLEPGSFTVFVGGSQPTPQALAAGQALSIRFEVTGEALEMEP